MIASAALVDTSGAADTVVSVPAAIGAADDASGDSADAAAPLAAAAAGSGSRAERALVRAARKLRPAPAQAHADRPRIYDDGCFVDRTVDGFKACTYGARKAKRTVVLVGDSKAAQWFTPVNAMAKRAGWRLIVIVKGGCEFADADRLVNGKRNPSCEKWAPRALRTIVKMRPDVVLTVTFYETALRPGGTTEADYTRAAMVSGLTTYWKRVLRTGAKLVPILDTPKPNPIQVPECVQRNLDRPVRCAFDRKAGVRTSGAPAQRAAARRVSGARPVNLTKVFCPRNRCPVVVGNRLVYREGTHVTNTFIATTRKALARRVHRATGGLLDGR